MDFFINLALFATKTLFITGAIVAVIIVIFQLSALKRSETELISIEKINDRLKRLQQHLQSEVLDRKAFKAVAKNEKKQAKQDSKTKRRRVFLLDFDGDVRASATRNLREEITAILSIAEKTDEVVLRLESGGGLVTSYGLAASQLARLRAQEVSLTVCVDKVAASGGYMMACVANKIVAAPFAVLGSIGVIAQVPNFNRILKRNDVEYHEVTAGQFKRTVTLFGEITPAGYSKFREQIEETHRLFKEFVKAYRPSLNIEKTATGEHWFGTQAVELGLVDELRASDDYVIEKCQTHDVYTVGYRSKKRFSERISDSLSAVLQMALESSLQKLWSHIQQSRFGS